MSDRSDRNSRILLALGLAAVLTSPAAAASGGRPAGEPLSDIDRLEQMVGALDQDVDDLQDSRHNFAQAIIGIQNILLAFDSKIVFVTSAEYTGNLGGLDGADAKCQAHATNAGFVGTFYAWLSTARGPVLGHPEVGPLHRFTRHAVRYVRPDGVKVADHFGDLIDGTLDNPINVDDLGNQLFFENFTWSSTTANGVPAIGAGLNSTCENWTADGAFKTAFSLGSVGATDFNWSSPAFSAAELCYYPHRLICVEQ